SVFGEGSDLREMPEGPAIAGVMTERAVGGHPRGQGEGADVTDVFHSARTPAALSAHGNEGHHHMVADGEIGDTVPDFTNCPGAFVAADRREHGWQPERSHHLV